MSNLEIITYEAKYYRGERFIRNVPVTAKEKIYAHIDCMNLFDADRVEITRIKIKNGLIEKFVKKLDDKLPRVMWVEHLFLTDFQYSKLCLSMRYFLCVA